MKKQVSNYQSSKIKNIHKLLRKLGISKHAQGYIYLTDAIVWFIESQNLSELTKVSHFIAEKRGVESHRVEIFMARAINAAYKKGNNMHIWEYLFLYSKDRKLERPSNYDFIRLIGIFLKKDIDFSKFDFEFDAFI